MTVQDLKAVSGELLHQVNVFAFFDLVRDVAGAQRIERVLLVASDRRKLCPQRFTQVIPGL